MITFPRFFNFLRRCHPQEPEGDRYTRLDTHQNVGEECLSVWKTLSKPSVPHQCPRILRVRVDPKSLGGSPAVLSWRVIYGSVPFVFSFSLRFLFPSGPLALYRHSLAVHMSSLRTRVFLFIKTSPFSCFIVFHVSRDHHPFEQTFHFSEAL